MYIYWGQWCSWTCSKAIFKSITSANWLEPPVPSQVAAPPMEGFQLAAHHLLISAVILQDLSVNKLHCLFTAQNSWYAGASIAWGIWFSHICWFAGHRLINSCSPNLDLEPVHIYWVEVSTHFCYMAVAVLPPVSFEFLKKKIRADRLGYNDSDCSVPSTAVVCRMSSTAA